MYLRNQLLFLLILFLPNSLFGQTEEVYVYDQVDGLFPKLTTHVTQCNQGYIWTLNDGLINRFDGQIFWPYPPSPNNLLGSEEKLKGLCSYQDSLLFLHSDNYLFLLNPELNEWQSFPMVNDNDTAKYTVIEFQRIGVDDIILHCLKNNESTYWNDFEFLRFRNQKIEPIRYVMQEKLSFQTLNEFGDIMQKLIIEEENGNIVNTAKLTATHPWIIIDSLENKYIFNNDAIHFFDSLGNELGAMYLDSLCRTFHCRKSFMQLDPKGRLNVLVSGRLGFYDTSDSILKSHAINQFQLFSDSNKIKSFFFEPNETLWIFGYLGHLVYYNARRNNYFNYGDIFNSNENNWHVGFQDKSKVVWVASDFGLAKIQPRTSFFNQFIINKKDAPPDQSDETLSNTTSNYSPLAGMTEDKQCNIYGIYEDNIFKVDSENKDTFNVLFQNVDRSMDILSTDQGVLLSSGRLLNIESGEVIKIQNSHPPLDGSSIVFHPFSLNFEEFGLGDTFKVKKNESNKKRSKRFYSDLLLKDKNQEIWRANDSTLYYLDQSEENWIWKEVMDTLMTTEDRKDYERHLGSNYEELINVFYLGKYSNKLWMGYRSGRLLSYSIETKKLERIEMKEMQPFVNINAIEEDSSGKLWIATDNGLYHLDPLSKALKIYNERDGLCNESILGMLSEGDSCYWLATEKGLSRFHISSESFINFFEKDGLPSNKFDVNSYFQTKDGQMFFSTRGESPTLISFFPQEVFQAIKDLNKGAQLVLSSFEYADGDRDTIMNKHNLTNNSTIELGHNTKFLAFQYALTDFQAPRNIHYSYQLEGYEDSWSKPSISNNIRFGSLPPGEYTFHAKARDHNLLWHPSQFRMNIIIHPPWWKTGWAYFGYFLFLSGFGYFIFSFIKRRLELQAQLKREQQEAVRLKELDNFKSKLYTNLTHEFRTPLTVILGMVQQIRNEPKKYLDEGTRMIETNGRNLLRLINQLLDLSKLEDRSFQLKLQQSDIIPYIKYLTESFHTFVNSKNLSLQFFTMVESLVMDHDREQIKQVLTNLISNAVKFTPSGGEIIVRVTKENEQLKIEVKDTGIGIAEEDLINIFDRFYQVDGSMTREGEGTGIGLAHTQELVKLMGGKVSVNSVLEKGSTFIIYLPIRNQAPIGETILKKEAISKINLDLKNLPNLDSPISEKNDLPQLLIIEDNHDVVVYLKSCLEKFYQIDVAYNGQVGIEKALEHIPDLIISDVMMPQKNGFEVCDFLKNDERTSHIPIILLTAKADADSKIVGLKRGADAYLSKPFDKEELLVRLEKLVERQKKMIAYFSKNNLTTENPTEEIVVEEAIQIEDAFIQKVKKIIEENYSDENFALPQLCQKIRMSRSQLFRKMKALVDTSPSEFIRTYRLKKAKHFLETTEMNVSEVSWEVGFKDVSHFSKVFQTEFGYLPSKNKK